MIDCNTCSTRLDAYLDGQLAAVEREEIDAHLAGCPGCRAEAAAIRSLLTEARALPRSVMPERELWTGIAARLSVSNVDVPRSHALDAGLRASTRLPGWGRLAAAIALMLLGAGLGALWQRRSAPSGFAAEQARYTAASSALAGQLTANPGAIAPATRAAVERNLAIIDRAIGEAEAALAADPGNTPLEQMLVARYEQRLALLRHALGAGPRES
jgi:anti-sigma factor RsiW